MLTFSINGECGVSGIWKTITTARGFNSRLLNIPNNATHYIRFTTGSVAELIEGEVITGGTSASTALIVGKVLEQGTAAGSDEEGVLFLNKVTGTPTATGETWTGTSTGTVATAQAPIGLKVQGPAKAALITVETASISFTLDGTNPTASAGTNFGHQMAASQSYVVAGWNNIANFKCINTVNASGAIVKYSLFY